MVTTTYVVVGLVSALLLVVCAAGPDERARHRAGVRRRRYVEAHPTQVTSHDVRRALVAAGVDDDQADLVLDKAEENGVRPFTMWLWLAQYDAETLAVVVTADVPQRDILTHLGDGTRPDLAELRVFASANGFRPLGTRRGVARTVLAGSATVSRRPGLAA